MKILLAVLALGAASTPLNDARHQAFIQTTDPPPSAAFPVVDRPMTAGFAVSGKREIDTIILHSSYDPVGKDPYSVRGVVRGYERYGVSAHYLIDRAGAIYRLVPEKNVSYHAGASRMPDGRTNVNRFSLGIEIMNKKDDSYTPAQYAAARYLISRLKGQYPIRYVLGHNKIAPDRKSDPWNFNWNTLRSPA